MQPLSPVIRRLYLLLFVSLFVAMLPLIILYADGWRYKQGFGFVRTGGMYIGVPYPDADVYVNDAHIGRSGFLERSFYVGDLVPADYVIRVEREGYRPWKRVLIVDEQVVTDANALLLPISIASVRLIAATSTDLYSSTSTRTIPRDEFNSYNAAFALRPVASSTLPIDESNGVGLFIQDGVLFARWIQESAFPPSQFCTEPSECAEAIILENNTTVSTARFFRGGVVFTTTTGEVHFIEPDVRQTPIHMLLFSAQNPDIRIIDDTLIVKSGASLYEIQL